MLAVFPGFCAVFVLHFPVRLCWSDSRHELRVLVAQRHPAGLCYRWDQFSLKVRTGLSLALLLMDLNGNALSIHVKHCWFFCLNKYFLYETGASQLQTFILSCHLQLSWPPSSG